MPKTLADGRSTLYWLPKKPNDVERPTAAELNAGTDLSCIVMSSFSIGPTGSDTINEKTLCQVGNPKVYTTSNYEADMTFIRHLDDKGHTEGAAEDKAFHIFKEGKGTHGYFVYRTGPRSADLFEAGDVVSIFEVISDDPADDQAREGYIKFKQPVAVQNAWIWKTVV